MRRRSLLKEESGGGEEYIVPCNVPGLNIVPGYPDSSGQKSASNTYTDLTYLSIEAGRNFAILINGAKNGSGGGYGNATKRWAFYKSDKTFISRGYVGQQGDTTTRATPANAAYIVVAVTHTSAQTVLPLMSVVYEMEG